MRSPGRVRDAFLTWAGQESLNAICRAGSFLLARKHSAGQNHTEFRERRHLAGGHAICSARLARLRPWLRYSKGEARRHRHMVLALSE